MASVASASAESGSVGRRSCTCLTRSWASDLPGFREGSDPLVFASTSGQGTATRRAGRGRPLDADMERAPTGALSAQLRTGCYPPRTSPIRCPSGSWNCPSSIPSMIFSGPITRVPPRLSALASAASMSGTST